METKIILAIALIILSLLSLIISLTKENLMGTSLSSIALVTFINIFIEFRTPPTPSAIDVYRNNTELKITYEICNGDTLSCDSTVIFKDNICKIYE